MILVASIVSVASLLVFFFCFLMVIAPLGATIFDHPALAASINLGATIFEHPAALAASK